MIPKSGRPNKILNSDYRKTIDELLSDGKSPEYIEDYLKSEHNYKCSAPTIRKYRKEHYNIQVEGNKKYYQRERESKERLEKSANDYADKREKISDIIDNLFDDLNIDELTPGQKTQLLMWLLREDRERDKIEAPIVNVENQLPNFAVFFDEDVIEDAIDDFSESDGDSD